MKLAHVTTGEDNDEPLLIVHGLFGSGRNWGVIQKRLSDRYRVTAVDLRNHGASPWSDRHDYPAMAEDLAEMIPERSHVVGHSMGGKAAMTLALRHPDKVGRLIVADIAPVAYSHDQARYINAMRSIDLSRIETRKDADAALAARIDDPGIRAFLLQSLDVAGKCWRLNLDALEREMPTITGWHGPEGRFEGEVLFLSGENSTYVTRDARQAIRPLFPNARFATLRGAGHWLHAEKPREVEESIRVFLGA